MKLLSNGFQAGKVVAAVEQTSRLYDELRATAGGLTIRQLSVLDSLLEAVRLETTLRNGVEV